MTTENEQVFSYEDVEVYNRVVHLGDVGWILDKGKHVCTRRDLADDGHIYVEFESDERDPMKLHERLVDKYLREKRRLWVDFDDHFGPGERKEKPSEELSENLQCPAQ